jgi:hypothetical protein
MRRSALALVVVAVFGFLGCNLFKNSEEPAPRFSMPSPADCEGKDPGKIVVECNMAGTGCKCIDIQPTPRDLGPPPGRH